MSTSIVKLPSRKTQIRIAAAANVDPRTLAKYYSGTHLHPCFVDAIRRAHAELGVTDPRAQRASIAGAK